MWFTVALVAVGAVARHHNIRAEVAQFNQNLGALADEATAISTSRKTLLDVGTASLKQWEKSERKSEKSALAALRRNDIAFDAAEQQMEKLIHPM
jgi:uncharacterized protein involved in exopolysaccharide biosynthesis